MPRTPLCDILGIEFPVILAPMGCATSAELAAAVSNQGGLGSIAAGRQQETLPTAGQTAGGITEILPVAEIMRRLVAETEALSATPRAG